MERLFSFIIAITFCIFLFNCQSPRYERLVTNSLSTSTANLTFEYYNIPIDSLSLFYYQKHSILKKDLCNYLYGYNKITHSIDVFNITKKLMVKHINLDDQGPNGILRVYGLNVIDTNTIYIVDQLMLKCLNNQGDVTAKYPLIINELPEDVNGYFIQLNEARFHISNSQKVFSGYFVDNRIKGKRNKANLKHPIVGNINLVSKEVEFLPIYYSNFIQNNNGDFSSEITPNITFHGNKIIYGFPVESNIYVYYKKSKTTVEYGGASNYCENLAKRYSVNKNYNFRNEGTWFNSVNYDINGDYYFRTHWCSQPKVDQLGRLTNGLTKPGYIMLFDNEFNIIDEFSIKDDFWIEDSFLSSEGIFFWPKIDSDYPVDTLKLGCYKVVINN